MKKEFFAPSRFRMAIPPGLKGVAGGLIFPAGIPAPTLIRRDLSKKYPHLKRHLLDPQLYLATLPPTTCRKTCVNLSSYGWFSTEGLKRYESGKQSQSEWKQEAMKKIDRAWKGVPPQSSAEISAAILKCVFFQDQMECEAIILPSPLTTDLGSDYSTELNWLDIGLKIASKVCPGKPRIATIALSDTCLRGIAPWKNDLLSVIVDQVTARIPEGAYIVIEQSNEHGYYCTHPNTIGSLIRLAFQLKDGRIQRVIVGPIGLAGLLALTVGADMWSTGWYRGERRMLMTDFQDQMGMAVPTYYTHPLASEIHLENDLDRLNARGLIGALTDETQASKGLLRALRSGHRVSSVPEWQYRQSNVATATDHFFSVITRETENLSGRTREECIRYARDWLRESEKMASHLYGVGGFNPRTELNHQAAWRQAYDEFLSVTGLT